MVKANAYGHGDVEVALVLENEGVANMGVATVEEGIGLRRGGVRTAILVFGLFDDRSAEETIRADLTPVVSTWEHIDHLSHHLTDQQNHPIHLKFNTGMNRLGFDISECPRLVDYFKAQSQMRIQGICTHFFRSEDAQDMKGFSQVQIQKFLEVEKAFAEFDPEVHLSNSASHLLKARADASGPLTSRKGLGGRPGLALYGVSPLPPGQGGFGAEGVLGLLPVMEVKSALGIVRRVPKGESVSYGPRWIADRESWVGVVPLGYADGYPRLLSNKGSMVVSGHRVPVIGTVCMDYTMVDLTDVALAHGIPQVGDDVIVIGGRDEARVTVWELAELCGTIPYEILTGFSQRLPRVFVGMT